MSAFRNVHACLVHESRQCVIDLVKNMHHLDPDSTILLYNGGTDSSLLDGFPFDQYNAVVHPNPRRMRWGWLHGFAIDCFRFALEKLPFNAMTIVDSDQLGIRPGYSAFIRDFLATRPRVGLLGCEPPQSASPKAAPAVQAMKEATLWRSFLQRFPDGESKYVRWTFWPSTVFTVEAARALVKLWEDSQLQQLLAQTKIWATEEVILPTLVALLGFELEQNPCRYDLVKYRVNYSTAQLDAAFQQPDAFWVHPVPRRFDDPLRRHIRARFNQYEPAGSSSPRPPSLLLTWPIINEMRSVEGWLTEEEADLLIASTAHALSVLPSSDEIVEVGSFCGKATLVMTRVAEALGTTARVHAIDPMDGIVGAHGVRLQSFGPTRQKLEATLSRAGLAARVRIHAGRAQEISWSSPIGYLLIDGLHDYPSVAADFSHLEPHVVQGGFVAFHDYADYFPGVSRFVRELLQTGRFQRVHCVGTLIVLRKLGAAKEVGEIPAWSESELPTASVERAAAPQPLVSCIMPTANRRHFVPLALRCWLRQDYPARELIIVDDGTEPIADLLPEDSRIRYLRLDGRRTVGAKRNLACQQASGQIIVHWDDDDWSAPWRLERQVRGLLSGRGVISGLTRVYYHQPSSGRSWQYVYPEGQRPWVAGNTLCYTREAWSRTPFPDIDVGEDARFIWSDPARKPTPLEDNRFFVAMIHDANVDPKRIHNRAWQPHPTDTIRNLMGQELDEYWKLCRDRSFSSAVSYAPFP